jgi:hypothetical protein
MQPLRHMRPSFPFFSRAAKSAAANGGEGRLLYFFVSLRSGGMCFDSATNL